MSFQAYLDSVKAKTGKTPADFAKLATQKGLTKHGELLAWLKSEHGLGHGHATAVVMVLLKSGPQAANPKDNMAKLFAGKKEHWRNAIDAFLKKIQAFGPDTTIVANETYINIMRSGKRVGILQISSAERLDVGIKLKGVAPTERLELAGSWNAMVTHRVRVVDAKELNAEVLAWLKQAHANAAPKK